MITRSTSASRSGASALRSAAGMRGRMGDQRLQAWRKAFDFRGPVGEQRSGRHQQAWLLLRRLALASEHEQQRRDLNGFAEPHVVGQASPEPELREQIEPAHAHLLVGPQRAVQRRAGIDARPTPPGCEVLSASRASQGLRPLAPNRGRPAASSAATSAPASMRMASPKLRPFSAAVRSTSRKCSIIRLSRSRSTSTQRPRTSASPSDLASNSLISAAVKRLAVERDFHAEIEKRILPKSRRRLAADFGRHLRARRAVGPPRRRHPHDHAGALQLRNVLRKLHGLPGVQRSGWKISPASTMAFSHGQISAARCTGRSSDKQTILVGRAGIFAQRLAQRKMLGFGVRREPRGVGCEKSEGRLLVFAVFGKIEVHAADQVPRGIAALQEFLDRAFRLGQLDGESRVHFLPESLKDLCRQIFRARHRRRRQGQRLQLRIGGAGTRTFAASVADVRLGAEGRHIPCAEFSPVGEDGRKRSPDFTRSELEKPMTRSPREGLANAGQERDPERAVVHRTKARRPCGVRIGAREFDSIGIASLRVRAATVKERFLQGGKSAVLSRPGFSHKSQTRVDQPKDFMSDILDVLGGTPPVVRIGGLERSIA